jgi:cellulose synthase (UDP-forming)
VVPLDVSGELLLVFLLPYWVCQSLSMSWLTGGHRSAFWSEVYETLLCVPMTLTVISTFVKPFGKPFKVSRKGENRKGPTFNINVGAPLLMLLCLYLGALAYAMGNVDWYASGTILTLAVGWSIYSMVLIWLALQACMDPPQSTASLRFRHRVPGVLWSNGVPLQVSTQDISDVDATITAVSSLMPHLGAARLVLDLQIPGWQPQEVTIIDGEAEHMCLLQWRQLPLEQHRAIISFLFTRPGQWDERGVPEHRTFWHFLIAPFRMHSFIQAASYRVKYQPRT